MQNTLLERDAIQAPLWLLVLVTLSGTMAMHIFVPALPVAGAALGAAPASMQQTISLYIIGLAVGQLIYGPISDALGRRPALLAGLALYLAGSALSLLAPSIEWLIGARLLQALGGASGLTLGRAIVRDTSPPSRITKDIATLNLLTLIGPGLGPIVGAYLADHFGWRAVFIFLTLIACAMLACAWRLLPETNRLRRPLHVRGIAADFRSLLGNRHYTPFLLGGACATTAIYPYLVTAPYIVHEQLGLPISVVGWFAAATILGASVGNFTTQRLAGRVSTGQMMLTGAGISLSMAILLLVLQLWGNLTATALIAMTVILTFGSGLSSPVSLARALASAPTLAGSAAGLYGFGQMTMGAIGTKLVGFGTVPAVACALTQILITTLSLTSFYVGLRRSQQSPPAA